MPDRVEQMRQIQEAARALFAKKNADYGDAFAKFGLIGVLVRLEDKIQRALSIETRKIVLVNDESLQDTLLDLHNYAAMALMLLAEKKETAAAAATEAPSEAVASEGL